MRVTSGKSRVRESRLPGSVRAKPNGRATRPRPAIGARKRLAAKGSEEHERLDAAYDVTWKAWCRALDALLLTPAPHATALA